MTYYTTRRRLLGFASSATLLGALMTAGTQLQAASLDHHVTLRGGQPDALTARPHQATRHFWNDLALENRDAWSRLRDSFQWQDEAHEPRVQAWIDHYRQSPHNIAEITERARPWLAWITQKVEERGLPGEIALIPFIESSFDPSARSHRGAAGLWQFMPRTGDSLGLSRQRGYDGRLDVVASTYAALDYIEYQADQWYKGDLELSLAAYNAGAGTVNKARRRALAQGKGGDYWSLSLPRETMNYVPKLKAIAAIIDDPDHYDVALPEIEEAPAFAKIPVERPLRLDEAARLAGVSPGTITTLNPGVTGGAIRPGNDRVLLVPAERADAMLASLEAPTTPSAAQDSQYLVRRGDTLAEIAAYQGISVGELRRANGLSGNLIRPGQTLELPTRRLASR